MTDIHQPETSDLDRSDTRTPTIDIHSAYVRRPEDERVAEAIRKAVEATLRGPEGRGVALTAPSGAGKSTLMQRVVGRHPLLGDGPDAACRYVVVDVTSPCTLKDLGRAVCSKAGYTIENDRIEAGRIWTRASEQLRQKNIRFVMFDEIQNITEVAKKGEDRQILNTLKTLMVNKDWHVGLILVGLPSIVPFLGADRQVRRRIRFQSLDPLVPESIPNMSAVVRSFAERQGLRCRGGLATDVVPRLMHAAEYQFGSALEIARGAIDIALDEGEVELNKEHFAREYAELTGNAAFANPFLAVDWAALDCYLNNVTRPEQLVVEEEIGPRRKRGNRTR